MIINDYINNIEEGIRYPPKRSSLAKLESKDTWSKIEENAKRYHTSEKGKQAKKRYILSDRGREARQRYLKSEKGQQALLRYYLSERGITTRGYNREKAKLFTKLTQYLKDNPTKTTDDFFYSLKQEDSIEEGE